ncbi:OsmC family protein [Salana multivorans]|uniref:OsmC family protein n=1 Tax=Salana multivorans TaxID=120377 RepID=UPI0024927F8A|nr:OsmC family protein [Salana multivorans]
MSDDATHRPETPAPGESTTAPALYVERTGPIAWTGHNGRGAEVLIGKEGAPGVFSPGELLAIAVAGCTGMSAEGRITSELGDGVAMTVGVERVPEPFENRYARFVVELVVSGPEVEGQDASRRTRMLTTAQAGIAAHCTVSRTLEAGAPAAATATAVTVTAELP